ncbi:MAG: ABC transporter permease [Deltaproteobacteria bacterium]|nr:ABC transporter permease [Deltaproteobacteria bacterium]MBI2182056.1 ABC transporter permease [Deltaproteobacteria bacterium]MBI2533141.1 ABC transporter permease [Deltaproteobacteria bacterium]MBI3064033.1 ABC transporter permease [Deltaproteobacteria bacterium]
MERKSAVISPLVWQLISFALFFGLWEIAGRWPISFAFPPFSKTLLALLRMLADGSLPKAYLSTLQPLIIGIVLCSVAGIGFGIGMGLSRAIEWFSLPVFIILQAAPMAAIIPLITYMYGIGLTSKVLAVVVLAAPVIVMNSYKGIRNTNPSLIQMCRAFLGTRRQEVIKIILPHAAALIFAGLRLGLAMGFIGIVIAELLITPTGIGDLITYHSSVADYPEMFAAIASIILFAALTIHALERLEQRLFPPETRGLEDAG